MNSAERLLLDRAAACYEQAGEPLAAARLRERTGTLLGAARLYERCGEWAEAAACYRRAGRTGDAVRCHLLLGQVREAARCAEQAGDSLTAAWLLASAGGMAQPARWTLAGASVATAEERLRRDLVAGLCDALDSAAADALAATVAELCRDLGGFAPAERGRLVRWAVGAADAVGRRDLSALVHAAAHRAGIAHAADRWREWARQALGGTAWIPRDASDGTEGGEA